MPANCHAKGGMTGHSWMNRKLGRLRAIGAVFGFQWLYSEAASQEKGSAVDPLRSPDDLPPDFDFHRKLP